MVNFILYFTYCRLCAVSGFKFCYLYNLKIHKKNKLYSSSNTYLFHDGHMLVNKLYLCWFFNCMLVQYIPKIRRNIKVEWDALSHLHGWKDFKNLITTTVLQISKSVIIQYIDQRSRETWSFGYFSILLNTMFYVYLPTVQML